MKYRYQSGDLIYEVLLERHDDGYRVTVNGESYEVKVLDSQPGALSLQFGASTHPSTTARPAGTASAQDATTGGSGTASAAHEVAELDHFFADLHGQPPGHGPTQDATTGGSGTARDAIRPQVVYWGAEGDVKWLSSGGCTYRLERPKARGRGGAQGAAEDVLRAPMPAQVRAVQVAEGDAVEAGQTLLILEAMKMEIKLASPRAATVCRVLARAGETVEKDQVLVELE